jgi:arabinose-5-phosphate isomerase
MLRTVADLMHGGAELPLVAEATPMPDALLVMTEKRWGIVGVTDQAGQLTGAITDGDLRRHIDGLLTHAAGEVMTAGPKKTVPPTMLASEALALMSDPAPAVTVLFVVDAGRPVGILHVHDILRAGVM